MNGTNANTGKSLTGLDHLRQSITDIITTPKGTRVMRRDYGSDMYKLLDAPTNRDTVMDMYQAVADALALWETRFSLQKITLVSVSKGSVVMDLTGTYKPDGQTVTLDGITVTS